MTQPLTEPPRKPYHTFLNFPLATDLDNLQADGPTPACLMARPIACRR